MQVAKTEPQQYVKYGQLVPGMCNSLSCFQSGNNEPHVHAPPDGKVVNLAIGDFVTPEADSKGFYPCLAAISKPALI